MELGPRRGALSQWCPDGIVANTGSGTGPGRVSAGCSCSDITPTQTITVIWQTRVISGEERVPFGCDDGLVGFPVRLPNWSVTGMSAAS